MSLLVGQEYELEWSNIPFIEQRGRIFRLLSSVTFLISDGSQLNYTELILVQLGTITKLAYYGSGVVNQRWVHMQRELASEAIPISDKKI